MSAQLKSYEEKVSDSLQRLFPYKNISRKGHCSKTFRRDVSGAKTPFEIRKHRFNIMIHLNL